MNWTISLGHISRWCWILRSTTRRMCTRTGHLTLNMTQNYKVLNIIKRSDSKHVCDCTSDSSHADANCYIWWILQTQKKLESGAKVKRIGKPIYQSSPDLWYTVLSEPVFTRTAWLINLLFALTCIWEHLTDKKRRSIKGSFPFVSKKFDDFDVMFTIDILMILIALFYFYYISCLCIYFIFYFIIFSIYYIFYDIVFFLIFQWYNCITFMYIFYFIIFSIYYIFYDIVFFLTFQWYNCIIYLF